MDEQRTLPARKADRTDHDLGQVHNAIGEPRAAYGGCL
jgi:hypothetical protein